MEETLVSKVMVMVLSTRGSVSLNTFTAASTCVARSPNCRKFVYCDTSESGSYCTEEATEEDSFEITEETDNEENDRGWLLLETEEEETCSPSSASRYSASSPASCATKRTASRAISHRLSVLPATAAEERSASCKAKWASPPSTGSTASKYRTNHCSF